MQVKPGYPWISGILSITRKTRRYMVAWQVFTHIVPLPKVLIAHASSSSLTDTCKLHSNFSQNDTGYGENIDILNPCGSQTQAETQGRQN
jgi:hypothetical protein